MAKRSDRSLVVGLDIGTSKVVALVGEIQADGSIEVVGLGSHPSRGLKKGVVVNIESTVQSIQRAVEEAELMAGCEIHSVYAGIAGSHVRSPELARRRRDPRQGSDAGRRRARHRRREGRRDSRRPEDPARAAAGIHHRRPGRHPRSHRHVGRAPRSEGAHRHRRGQRRAEHREVHAALRPRPSRTWCSSSSRRASPCSPKTRKSWACASSTSAAARPTSPCSRTARSATRR